MKAIDKSALGSSTLFKVFEIQQEKEEIPPLGFSTDSAQLRQYSALAPEDPVGFPKLILFMKGSSDITKI